MKNQNYIAILASLLLATTTSSSDATLVITATEVDGDVVFVGSGSANLEAFSTISGDFLLPDGAINPFVGYVYIGNAPFPDRNQHRGPVSGPNSFGTEFQTNADSSTGDSFGIFRDGAELSGQLFLTLPGDYVSNSPLDGMSVYENETFSSLGINPGTYVYTWGSGATADSLTFQAIPEASMSLCFSALTIFTLIGRRKVRASSPNTAK